MHEAVDVVVVGAGQAGLAISYHLKQTGITHVVLERGGIGESWRSQRWTSFYLNTPNWLSGLPALPFRPDDPDGFGHRDEFASYLETYARTFDLPVRQHAAVTAAERQVSGGYVVRTGGDTVSAKALVLASGAMSRPRVPDMARLLAADIVSLSAGDYRDAAELPAGAVVVVGSGQSGCQVAEDLLDAGRRVYVCTGRVGRAPRTHRGRDILAWWSDMGFLDVRVEDLEDPSMRFAAQPQVSGTEGGHTVSLQSLARDGATLLGRVVSIDGAVLTLGDDLRANIAFADDKARSFRAEVDAYITRAGIAAPSAEPDPGEPPLPDLGGSDEWRTLDLRAAGVGSVIWCTGFDADWSWVKVAVFDEHGRPRHRRGVTDVPGLYFIGLPWLATRKSGIIYGVADDAARITQHIASEVLGTGAR